MKDIEIIHNIITAVIIDFKQLKILWQLDTEFYGSSMAFMLGCPGSRRLRLRDIFSIGQRSGVKIQNCHESVTWSSQECETKNEIQMIRSVQIAKDSQGLRYICMVAPSPNFPETIPLYTYFPNSVQHFFGVFTLIINICIKISWAGFEELHFILPASVRFSFINVRDAWAPNRVLRLTHDYV